MNLEDKKIIIYDLETSPNVGYFWRPGYKISLSTANIVKERQIICASYKYLGNGKVHTLDWGNKKQCDKALLKKFSKILKGCDVAIGHNGDSFDLKWLKGRCLIHGLDPLTNIQTIDTLKLSRSNFNFNSNRLDYLGEVLGVGRKAETGGYQLWKDVMDKDAQALKKMIEYCEQDVLLLEAVFLKMASHVNKMPVSMGMLYAGERDNCPACSSGLKVKNGMRYSRTGYYQRYECKVCKHTWYDTRMSKL